MSGEAALENLGSGGDHRGLLVINELSVTLVPSVSIEGVGSLLLSHSPSLQRREGDLPVQCNSHLVSGALSALPHFGAHHVPA